MPTGIYFSVKTPSISTEIDTYDDNYIFYKYGNICYPDTTKYSKVYGFSSFAVNCVYNSDYEYSFMPGYAPTLNYKTPIYEAFFGIPNRARKLIDKVNYIFDSMSSLLNGSSGNKHLKGF